MSEARDDLLILGGGLSCGLAALALAKHRPDLSFTIVEREATLGGNHIWSFFESDVDDSGAALLDPLVAGRWDGYDVRFPSHTRSLDTGYRSITNELFDAAVREIVADDRIVIGDVTQVGSESVTLADGRTLTANAVLDMRGLAGCPDAIACGAQKFVGRMMRVPGGHRLQRPVVMDATVDQEEGYRFVYLLPFDDARVFVEDTYYRRDRALDIAALTARIDDYCEAQGWRAEPDGRLETGILPVVTGGAFDDFWPERDAVARGGVRAGLFHPLTSYSLPDAVRFAFWLCDALPMAGADLAQATRDYAQHHWRDGGFDRMLATMLFDAADPADRYRILERFYRLPGNLIERFYGGRTTFTDKARILAGKPPVRISRAIRAIMGNS